MMRLLPLLLVGLTLSSNLLAQEKGAKFEGPDPLKVAKELIACLDQEIEKQRAESAKGEPEAGATAEATSAMVRSHYATQTTITSYQRTRQTLELQLLPVLEAQNYTSALQYLSSLVRMQLPPACAKLMTSLNTSIMTRQKEVEALWVKQVEEFEAAIGKRLLEAQKPADLDEAIVEISELSKTSPSSSSNRNLSSRLSSILNIVTNWQEYLSELSVGDLKGARSELNSVASDLRRAPIIPRSKVLALQHELEGKTPENDSDSKEAPYTLESVLEEHPGLKDLEKAEGKLLPLTKIRSTASHAKGALNFVHEVKRLDQEIEEGDAIIALMATLNLNATRYSETRFWAESLKAELIEKCYAYSVEPKYRKQATTKPLQAAIEKTAHAMSKDKAWKELWSYLLATNMYLNKGRSTHSGILPWVKIDADALKHFFSAQRFEQAGEYARALQKYRSVLENEGLYGPYDEASQRIKSIRENHAEELEQSLQEEAKMISSSASAYRRYQPYLSSRGNLQQMIEKEVKESVSEYFKRDAKKAADEAIKKEAEKKEAEEK